MQYLTKYHLLHRYGLKRDSHLKPIKNKSQSSHAKVAVHCKKSGFSSQYPCSKIVKHNSQSTTYLPYRYQNPWPFYHQSEPNGHRRLPNLMKKKTKHQPFLSDKTIFSKNHFRNGTKRTLAMSCDSSNYNSTDQ